MTSLRFVRFLVVGVVATACALASPRLAWADSCADPEYDASVERSTVTFGGVGCDDRAVLLRQDEATGTVVQVHGCRDGSFVDECVPPGTYRYGPSTEMTCSSCISAVPLFAKAKVDAPADPTCTPSGKPSSPTTTSPPWGNGSMGSFKNCPGAFACAYSSPDRRRVFVMQGFAVAAGLLGMGIARRRRRRAATKPNG